MLRTRTTTLHPEAVAWAKEASANSGVFTNTHVRAISTFCADIDRAGIRNKFLRLSLMAGSNLAAALTPLYRGLSRTGDKYGNQYDYNGGPFISSDYASTTGLNGNGTSKYLDTGLDTANCFSAGMEYNSAHLMVCRPEARDSYSVMPIGGLFVDGEAFLGLLMEHGGPGSAYFGDFQGDNVVSSSSTASAGMYLAQMDGTAGEFLRNNQSIETGQTTAGGSSLNAFTTGVFVFAADDGTGSATNHFNGRLSAYSLGTPLTSGQRTAFYAAMQTFQAAIGRSL